MVHGHGRGQGGVRIIVDTFLEDSQADLLQLLSDCPPRPVTVMGGVGCGCERIVVARGERRWPEDKQLSLWGVRAGPSKLRSMAQSWWRCAGVMVIGQSGVGRPADELDARVALWRGLAPRAALGVGVYADGRQKYGAVSRNADRIARRLGRPLPVFSLKRGSRRDAMALLAAVVVQCEFPCVSDIMALRVSSPVEAD